MDQRSEDGPGLLGASADQHSVELATQRVDLLDVDRFRGRADRISDFGAALLERAELVGQLLDPWAALCLGHRARFERGEVPVDGLFGLANVGVDRRELGVEARLLRVGSGDRSGQRLFDDLVLRVGLAERADDGSI